MSGAVALANHEQVWTALVTMLLKFLPLKSRWGWSPDLVAQLRKSPFTHPDRELARQSWYPPTPEASPSLWGCKLDSSTEKLRRLEPHR